MTKSLKSYERTKLSCDVSSLLESAVGVVAIHLALGCPEIVMVPFFPAVETLASCSDVCPDDGHPGTRTESMCLCAPA